MGRAYIGVTVAVSKLITFPLLQLDASPPPLRAWPAVDFKFVNRQRRRRLPVAPLV